MGERFSTVAVDETVTRAGADAARPPILLAGPVLEVAFPGAGVRDVAHGLEVVPNGVVVLLEVGGNVQAAQVEQWTTDLAWLIATAVNTRARLYFVRSEDPVNV
jgi:hypothetical protein